MQITYVGKGDSNSTKGSIVVFSKEHTHKQNTHPIMVEVFVMLSYPCRNRVNLVNYACGFLVLCFVWVITSAVTVNQFTKLFWCCTITCVSIVCSNVCSGVDQRKNNQSSASLDFVRGIHRWPAVSSHTGLVTRKCFRFMTSSWIVSVLEYISHRSCWLFNTQSISDDTKTALEKPASIHHLLWF